MALLTAFIRHHFDSDDEKGQTLVEYGLLLAFLAIIVVVALVFLGPIVSGVFQEMGDSLQDT
jgi:pilus assembly protein Flp/PilA